MTEPKWRNPYPMLPAPPQRIRGVVSQVASLQRHLRMTRSELAAHLGLDPGHLMDIVSGYVLDTKRLREAASAVGLDLEAIAKEDPFVRAEFSGQAIEAFGSLRVSIPQKPRPPLAEASNG